jgi:hypothetical protein
MTDDIIIPLDDAGRPDLQKLVRRAGERYAASLGEPYEPARRGGYIHITEWDAWDEANREWRERRRLRLALPDRKG